MVMVPTMASRRGQSRRLRDVVILVPLAFALVTVGAPGAAAALPTARLTASTHEQPAFPDRCGRTCTDPNWGKPCPRDRFVWQPPFE